MFQEDVASNLYGLLACIENVACSLYEMFQDVSVDDTSFGNPEGKSYGFPSCL